MKDEAVVFKKTKSGYAVKLGSEMNLTPEQMQRIKKIAAKACIEFGVTYDGVSFAAEEAILAALADPLLKGKPVAEVRRGHVWMLDNVVVTDGTKLYLRERAMKECGK